MTTVEDDPEPLPVGTIEQLAANVRRELADDTPWNIAGRRSLTVTQLAYVLQSAGHPDLAQQIRGDDE